MAAQILENFDDFNFMVILLFLYIVLIGFLMMIIFNKNTYYSNKSKQSIQSIQAIQPTYSNGMPYTTIPQCIPKQTDGQC